jgi:hypothetical protein
LKPAQKSIILGIDFDGTLVDHCYPDIGVEAPGAFKWLKEFQSAGARLILWTMRHDSEASGPVLTQAVEFCRERDIEFWAVNHNPEQDSWSGSRKQYAHYYIDDTAIGCPLTENPRSGGREFVDWAIVGPLVMEKIIDWNRANS